MDLLAPLIVIVLLGVVVWLVSGPLRTGAGAADEAETARRDDLEAAKEAKYREIRDTELDREQGKLSQEDWTRQDAELRRDAVKILKELDEAKADAGRGVPAER